MAMCDCGRIQVNCAGGCGCACVENGPCYVICEGGPVFGPFNKFASTAVLEVHTHGSVPLVDVIKLLNFAVKGGINVMVPSRKFDQKVKLKTKGKLHQIIRKLKLKAVE
jgi:hypothetical protein